jgi:hypothetical protein
MDSPQFTVVIALQTNEKTTMQGSGQGNEEAERILQIYNYDLG